MHLFYTALAIALANFAFAQSPTTGLTPATFAPEPMPPQAPPAYLGTVTDPTFGTTVRRITDAPAGSRGIVPMYSTVQAWNADESLMIVYVLGEGHRLLDGRDYTFVKTLPIAPLDVEQVFWDHDDADVFYYPTYVPSANTTVYRAHNARTGAETDLVDLGAVAPACAGGGVRFGNDVQMPSRDDDLIGFRCQSEASYLHRLSTGVTTEVNVLDGDLHFIAATPSPSGAYAFHRNESYNADGSLRDVLKVKDGKSEHACLGTWADGTDALFAVAFERDDAGDCLGQLIGHDLATGACVDLLPQSVGYPYPRRGTHISALAHAAEPGWLAVSMIGEPDGAGLFDQELLLVRARKSGAPEVYRVGHHRSDESPVDYWGEPHVTLSPTGTRLLFGSDWGATGASATLQSYVVELPAFSGVPTPATLVGLSAKPTPDARIAVTWTTVAEEGVARFEVLAATADAHASIERVVATAAAKGASAYAVHTEALPAGGYYLRLRTVDADGDVALSRRIAVAVAGGRTRVLNTANGFRLDFGSSAPTALLRVFDVAGRQIYRSRDASAAVDARTWPAGVYVVAVGTSRHRWVRP